MRVWFLFLLFVLAGLAFAVATVPLSFALNLAGAERAGLRYAAAEGTMWKGRLLDAELGQIHFGTVDVATIPSALIRGRAEARWRTRGRSVYGQGVASIGLGGTMTFTNTQVKADLAEMPDWTPIAGAAVDGTAEGAVRELRFGGAVGCSVTGAQARAQVRVEAFGDPWTAPALQGEPRCDNRSLVVPLSGRDGDSAVDLAVALTPNGTYTARLTVATGDQKLIRTMETMGFERKVDGHEFVQDGRWGLGTGLQ